MLLLFGATLTGVLACGITADAQPPVGRGGRGAPAIGQRVGPGGRGNPEQMIERRVARLTAQLELSDDQAAQIETILTEEQAKMAALRPQERPTTPPDSATRAQIRVRHEALRAETNDRIESVLSAEQRVRYAELEQRMHEERGRGGVWRRRPPPRV
jgi:Spy/CpxP family protein refolding chaperone